MHEPHDLLPGQQEWSWSTENLLFPVPGDVVLQILHLPPCAANIASYWPCDIPCCLPGCLLSYRAYFTFCFPALARAQAI